MSKTEKIGRPSMKEPESGADIEQGFDKESIEATFPVIGEALNEFYNAKSAIIAARMTRKWPAISEKENNIVY